MLTCRGGVDLGEGNADVGDLEGGIRPGGGKAQREEDISEMHRDVPLAVMVCGGAKRRGSR